MSLLWLPAWFVAVSLLLGALCALTRGGPFIAAIAVVPIGMCVAAAGFLRVLG